MDFSTLLGLAQEKQNNKVDVKRYSTAVSGPKKINLKDKKLSENVRKFMEKKEEEERRKMKDEKAKTRALMAKRSEDKKSMKTMKSMLQRTKSANKAVIADAVDNTNTADTLAGRFQCDEDDYGYESGIANKFYDKLMKKYEANPEDPMAKFSKTLKKNRADIQNTLKRVKNALDEGEDEAPSSTSSHSSSSSKQDKKRSHEQDSSKYTPAHSSSSYSSDPEKKKTRKEKELEAKKLRLKNASKLSQMPSFHDLIKIAEEKKSTGSTLGDKPAKPKGSSGPGTRDYEFHRPMTTKMKEEFKREYLSKMRKAGKLPMSKRPITEPEQRPPPEKRQDKPSSEKNDSVPEKSSVVSKNKLQRPGSSKATLPTNPSKAPQMGSSKIPKETEAQKPMPKKSNPPASATSSKQPVKRDVHSVQAREFPGEKKIPQKAESFKPAQKTKNLKRNRIESDSEYDSEMDDFIDDSDAKIDISAQIRGIFGYDRRKYADEAEFDDRSMVADYSSIMREEIRSTKIGKMEDLEDMKLEEEEKRRKLAKKKRKY